MEITASTRQLIEAVTTGQGFTSIDHNDIKSLLSGLDTCEGVRREGQTALLEQTLTEAYADLTRNGSHLPRRMLLAIIAPENQGISLEDMGTITDFIESLEEQAQYKWALMTRDNIREDHIEVIMLGAY